MSHHKPGTIRVDLHERELLSADKACRWPFVKVCCWFDGMQYWVRFDALPQRYAVRKVPGKAAMAIHCPLKAEKTVAFLNIAMQMVGTCQTILADVWFSERRSPRISRMEGWRCVTNNKRSTKSFPQTRHVSRFVALPQPFLILYEPELDQVPR